MDEQNKNKVYNSLYPPPCEELATKLRSILEVSPKIQLSQEIDFKHKQLFPLLIKRSIKIFERLKCTGCTGSHKFYIAGGYGSYLANLTDIFEDIDIFIHCTGNLNNDLIQQTNFNITTYKNVSTIEFYQPFKPNVQFIQVNFDINVEKELQDTPLFRDLMAVYIMAKFDLPTCRVGVILPLKKDIKYGRIINLSAINVYKTPTTPGRLEKYKSRSKNIPLTPPTLQQSAIFSLMNKFLSLCFTRYLH